MTEKWDLGARFSLSISRLESQSVHADRDQKHRADKGVALKKSAINSDEIELLGFVFVKKSAAISGIDQ